jgi:hypothetical protein
MPYGIPQPDWDAAKAQAKALIAQRAHLRGMIPYSELCANITCATFAAHSPAFFALLGEVSEEEAAASNGSGGLRPRHNQTLQSTGRALSLVVK